VGAEDRGFSALAMLAICLKCDIDHYYALNALTTQVVTAMDGQMDFGVGWIIL
jgi:hypothetical protein